MTDKMAKSVINGFRLDARTRVKSTNYLNETFYETIACVLLLIIIWRHRWYGRYEKIKGKKWPNKLRVRYGLIEDP